MLVLLALALVSSLGVALSRDNFYAALYLALTTSLVGILYAYLGLTYGFVLIFIIYVGATVTVTVILAAVYRRFPFRGGLSWVWVIPMALFVVTMVLAYYVRPVNVLVNRTVDLGSFAESYALLFLSLFSLLVLLTVGSLVYYSRVRGG